MLNSSTLRQIWLIIERTQTRILLELSDRELIRRLQEQLEAQISIPDSELIAARNYIQSKVPLIRDFAESRLVSA
ncbi:MAG: hypothetical protein ACRC8K_16250 [Waterburya sp.]